MGADNPGDRCVHPLLGPRASVDKSLTTRIQILADTVRIAYTRSIKADILLARVGIARYHCCRDVWTDVFSRGPSRNRQAIQPHLVFEQNCFLTGSLCYFKRRDRIEQRSFPSRVYLLWDNTKDVRINFG